MLELTDLTFQDETSSGIVAIDFWAEWCAPCRMMMPAFERLSEKYDGKVKFCKVDTTVNSRITALNGVQSLPTIIIMKDGQPINKLVGLQPEKKISAVLDELMTKQGA